MLPFLLPVGLFSAVGYVMGKKHAKGRTLSHQRGKDATLQVQILYDHVHDEGVQILAVEEVPLDNRFGDRPLNSENEFSRSATISLDLDRSREVGSSVRGGFGKIFSSEISGELSKTLGVKIGSQINRKIRLSFSVSPGQRVLYRVVWRQESRRGEFEILVNGRKSFRVPYLVTYGLTHSVESVQEPEVPEVKKEARVTFAQPDRLGNEGEAGGSENNAA